MKTFAPSLASRTAAARPMPVVPPVMATFFPLIEVCAVWASRSMNSVIWYLRQPYARRRRQFLEQPGQRKKQGGDRGRTRDGDQPGHDHVSGNAPANRGLAAGDAGSYDCARDGVRR